MPVLSLLTVTKAEPHSFHFIDRMVALCAEVDADVVIGADGAEAHELIAAHFNHRDVTVVPVQSQGFLESVHDYVLSFCTGTYVLRLDDDEQCSPAMHEWIVDEKFLAHPHWKFPRAALWGDNKHFINQGPLWPDHQTRLSLKQLANGRNHIHAGSPYGGGEIAPVAIEHWKFLVKTYEQRAEIADRYDRIMWGAGRSHMGAFQLPEDVYGEEIKTAELGNGYFSGCD